MIKDTITLGEISFVTKLAGFEHTKYIQHNATHEVNDVPLVIGKNVKDGKVRYIFDWYIPQEISDSLPRSVLDKQCLVIPYVGSKLGELAVFRNDFKCHLGSNVAKVELLDDTLDIQYLYYYLSSEYGQLQLFKGKQGSAQPNITMTSIRETIVVKFEKSIQKQIAKVLSDLDAKIELNNKINAELEAMAKLIYDYWFVQFDFPIDKATAEKMGNPTLEGKPYKASGGKMVYNKELKREIPEGWRSGILEDVLEIGNGKDHKKLRDGAYPVYGSGGIMRYVNDYLYQKESVLIPRKGTLNNVFYINEPFWSVDTMFYSKMKKDNCAKYVYYIMKGINLSSMNVGTAVPSMTKIILNNIEILIPMDSTLKKFNDVLSPMFLKIKQNTNENQKLSELRDWLLPMLMNGQVRVNEK
jgi:type I restriction enzyme S subunit